MKITCKQKPKDSWNMNKSKIAVFWSAEESISLVEQEIPSLKPGEILVQNEYATLCRSDLHTVSGKRIEKTPTILGHEVVGRISKLGSDAPKHDLRGQELKVGDRISWAIYASNPEDELAKAGIPQKAADLFKYGHERITQSNSFHGGLGQHILLRSNTPIIKIDEGIPLPVASIINCAVATVAGAVRLAGELTGKKVLVSGAGMLGTVACAMSKSQGASRVVVADIDRERLAMAKEFGADEVLLLNKGQKAEREQDFGGVSPFQVVIETSGQATAMQQTLGTLSIGGTAVWIGAAYPQPDLKLNGEQVLRNLWTIRGLHNYNEQDFVHAVSFMEKYHTHFPFQKLIHDGFTLDQINEAFAYGARENPFRVGVRI
jgi:putative phosphonate catabolism associated alcohol dehydrogenase